MIILAVFKARSQSLDFLDRLYRYGVNATTTTVPKEARIGCGLCVRFSVRDYPRATAILKTGKYSSFRGFYKSEFVNGRISVSPYP